MSIQVYSNARRDSLNAQCRDRRAESRDLSLPSGGKARTERTDLGLALLSTLRLPGAAFTRQDIAIWCGCTDANIYMLERRAMKKLANKLSFGRARKFGGEAKSQ